MHLSCVYSSTDCYKESCELLVTWSLIEHYYYLNPAGGISKWSSSCILSYRYILCIQVVILCYNAYTVLYTKKIGQFQNLQPNAEDETLINFLKWLDQKVQIWKSPWEEFRIQYRPTCIQLGFESCQWGSSHHVLRQSVPDVDRTDEKYRGFGIK